MKRIVIYSLLLILATSCSDYHPFYGTWKATSITGRKTTISFSSDSMIINNEHGESVPYLYSIVSIRHHDSGGAIYDLLLHDGRKKRSIFFPIKGDNQKCVILDENAYPNYALGRDQYYSHIELYELFEQQIKNNDTQQVQ